MEKRIKDLCSQLSKAKDKTEVEEIGEQLRSAIHEYIENMRHKVDKLAMSDGNSP
jgi:hypothetical protein